MPTSICFAKPTGPLVRAAGIVCIARVADAPQRETRR
jgi:hypothetical protein